MRIFKRHADSYAEVYDRFYSASFILLEKDKDNNVLSAL